MGASWATPGPVVAFSPTDPLLAGQPRGSGGRIRSVRGRSVREVELTCGSLHPLGRGRVDLRLSASPWMTPRVIETETDFRSQVPTAFSTMRPSTSFEKTLPPGLDRGQVVLGCGA